MTENQVRLASVRYDYTPFLNGSVPIWPVYRNTQGIYLTDKLASAGEQVAFFDPSDHGVRFVANSVVTSQKMIEQQPEMVKRFVRALLAGWEAAMNPANETEVIQALSKSDPDTSPETMRRQLAVTRRMVQPDPARQWAASTRPPGSRPNRSWSPRNWSRLRSVSSNGSSNLEGLADAAPCKPYAYSGYCSLTLACSFCERIHR